MRYDDWKLENPYDLEDRAEHCFRQVYTERTSALPSPPLDCGRCVCGALLTPLNGGIECGSCGLPGHERVC